MKNIQKISDALPLSVKGVHGNYRILTISKKNGEFRNIYVTDKRINNILRGYLPLLEKKLKEIDIDNVNYAFVKGRNVALNAFTHIGYNYTLSLDIKNFFDSVRVRHVKSLLPKEVINDCFIDGAPRQGLPTSPLIANIALSKFDKLIKKFLDNFNFEFHYTRYADDLIFSFNDRSCIGKIKTAVEKLLITEGFFINKNKIKLQSVSNGRIVINGIAVDDEGLHATRKTKKKLRAALHQKNIKSFRGLHEWSLCKFPNKLVL